MAERLATRAEPTAAESVEPAILGKPPSHERIEDGALYPAAAVREMIEEADERGYRRGWDAAWADARRSFKRQRDELIMRAARETARFLKGETNG